MLSIPLGIHISFFWSDWCLCRLCPFPSWYDKNWVATIHEFNTPICFLAKGGYPDWFCCMQLSFWVTGTRIIQKGLTFQRIVVREGSLFLHIILVFLHLLLVLLLESWLWWWSVSLYWGVSFVKSWFCWDLDLLVLLLKRFLFFIFVSSGIESFCFLIMFLWIEERYYFFFGSFQ